MKIADIAIDVFGQEPFSTAPWVRRFRAGHETYGALVRVVTDDGVEGRDTMFVWSTLGCDHSRRGVDALCSQVLGGIKPELLGRDAADREWLWSRRAAWERRGVSATAFSAVDQAMWDIAGRAAGVPVYKLLGARREKVPVYASGPYYPEPAQHADLAAQARALGYPAFKVKPGGGPVERVRRIATAVREAVGDDTALMLDGQLRFDYQDALAIGRHLEALGYAWFEDPVRHDDYAALERLCGRLEIPVAYTDHPSVRFREAAEMARRPGGPRILRGDVARDGITGLRKLCAVADAFGRNCEVHASIMGNLHVILSIDNCAYYEDTLEDILDGRTGELRPRPEGHAFGVDERGFVHAPTAPGLGFSFQTDAETIERNKVETLR